MKTYLTTAVFLLRDGEILLAMKKRGFGQGKWNAPGGKVQDDETIDAAMVRECQEEISVTPIDYRKKAVLHFDEWHRGDREEVVVHVYVCTDWQGEPEESEEMAPQWFSQAKIPYDQMWNDDKIWLPELLEGKTFSAHFTLDSTGKLTHNDMQEGVI